MSGGGGFYKYRCKYFYTHNCQNWVWVNNAPCATCLSEGREDEQPYAPIWAAPRDIIVPRLQDGTFQYTMMELIAPPSSDDCCWTLRDKVTQPAPAIPVTSSVPHPAVGATAARASGIPNGMPEHF